MGGDLVLKRRSKIEEESEKSLNRGIKILENYKSKINDDRQKRLGIKKSKKLSTTAHIIRIGIIILIIIVVILLIDYGPILGIKILDLNSEHIVLDNVLSNESQYFEYNNELLIYTDGAICTYDKNGNKTWEYKLSDSFIPTIYTKR